MVQPSLLIHAKNNIRTTNESYQVRLIGCKVSRPRLYAKFIHTAHHTHHTLRQKRGGCNDACSQPLFSPHSCMTTWLLFQENTLNDSGAHRSTWLLGSPFVGLVVDPVGDILEIC